MVKVLEAAQKLISNETIKNQLELSRDRFQQVIPDGTMEQNPVMTWAKHQFGSYPAKNRLFNNLSIWGNHTISPIVASIMGLPEDKSSIDPETSMKMAAIFLMDQEIPNQAQNWSNDIQNTIEKIWSRKFK